MINVMRTRNQNGRKCVMSDFSGLDVSTADSL